MTTDQSTDLDSPRGKDGKLLKGAVINPKGKGGFQERPQDISPGGWSKEGSISYQYNRLMRMSIVELDEFIPETVAQDIALQRMRVARKEAGLNDAKEITDRTEGKAPQTIDMTSNGETLVPTVRIIDERPRNTDTE